MWSNWNSHSWLVGMQNGAATLEDSLVVSYKTKYTLTYDPEIMLLGIYPKEMKTYVHMDDVYSSFTHNRRNSEATKMSFSRRMDELWSIQTIEYSSVL